ncbi:hypothetical protein LSAT2_016060 [Lamellibrachia satsuma]|nr:hypothetical protein LSAT2_016060 [Lamellibrachia satsuma]
MQGGVGKCVFVLTVILLVDRSQSAQLNNTADCDPGLEERNGKCEPCRRGYYKDAKGAESCTLCSNGMITSGTGATTVNQCTIANCTAGHYLDATNNVCIACKQSSYQSEKWQTECKPCLNDKITDAEGRTSESDCIMGKTTERTGSLTKDQCTIADCREGSYFTADKLSCIVCPRGEYQDEPWQEKGCKKCPDRKTTPSTHSTSVTDCKRDCPSGRELDETTGDCDLCPRGFYKDQAQHFNCQQCPTGLTTQSTGSTSASDCNQGDCSSGYMFDGTDCKACPVGSYQDEKYQTSCKSCGNMMSTANKGATSLTECFSTNACTNRKNDCSPTDKGGICTPVGDGTEWTCGCRDAWDKQPGGNVCRHKCDNSVYCLHGATCSKNDLENPKCLCTDKYEGERCFIRSEPKSNNPYIIGGSIGGFLLLILIFVTVLAVCSCLRRHAKDESDSPAGALRSSGDNPAPVSVPESSQTTSGVYEEIASAWPQAKHDNRKIVSTSGGKRRTVGGFLPQQRSNTGVSPNPQKVGYGMTNQPDDEYQTLAPTERVLVATKFYASLGNISPQPPSNAVFSLQERTTQRTTEYEALSSQARVPVEHKVYATLK